MSPADRQFGKELGRRLAQLRQEAGLTQQAVAAHLGIAQQTLAHYEVGRLRLPVVLVTTEHEPRQRARYERLGPPDGYLSKPFDGEEARQLIGRLAARAAPPTEGAT